MAPIGDIARSHPGGIIDLSQGTPVDATPDFIQKVFAEAANSPGYPLTAGTVQLRAALKEWAINYLGASGDFDVLPTIGSKELVAWLPTFLQARTVLIPEIAYPTYLVGSIIAGAEATPVGIDASDWPKADMAWINSPSNPTGRVHSEAELSKVLEYSEKNNVVIASDECYLSFPDTVQGTSILQVANGSNRNILAVHSLSKRSNLAGYRAAFLVGDSQLISQIREFRKHAGLLVPLPVQKAMVAALSDEVHVVEQAQRYRARRKALQPALEAVGFTVEYSGAGLYIWCTRNETDWDSVRFLAQLGILATPGHFYGSAAATYIRVALTATDSAIADAVQRLLGSVK